MSYPFPDLCLLQVSCRGHPCVRLDEQERPLLNPVLKAGRIQECGLPAQAVYDLCLRLARLADKEGTGAFAPHDLPGGLGSGSCSRKAAAAPGPSPE